MNENWLNNKFNIIKTIDFEEDWNLSDNFKIHDKQWRGFNRKTNLFNPISIQKLDFVFYEQQGNGNYVKLIRRIKICLI